MPIPNPVVLVVEDEPSIQATLSATFSRVGLRTIPAMSIDQALRILRAEHVDAFILDVGLRHGAMPATSGLQFLSCLRSIPEYASVPVIIFTGKLLSVAEDQLARQCDAAVFYKPQRYAALIQYLKAAFDISGAGQPDAPLDPLSPGESRAG